MCLFSFVTYYLLVMSGVWGGVRSSMPGAKSVCVWTADKLHSTNWLGFSEWSGQGWRPLHTYIHNSQRLVGLAVAFSVNTVIDLKHTHTHVRSNSPSTEGELVWSVKRWIFSESCQNMLLQMCPTPTLSKSSVNVIVFSCAVKTDKSLKGRRLVRIFSFGNMVVNAKANNMVWIFKSLGWKGFNLEL